MDPAAVRELQRLYAQKHAISSDRPIKRRRTNSATAIVEEDESQRSSTSTEADNDEAGISSSSDTSFTGFDSDLELSRTANDTEEVHVVTFDAGQVNPSQNVAIDGYKSFMSGKVSKLSPSATKSTQSVNPKDVDEEEADNLQKDKELQRLLRESNLLHEVGSDSVVLSGKSRLKAIAQQRVANGASKPKERKMPIGMRMGIRAAATNREAAAEKFVKENNIITARKAAPAKKKKMNQTLHELNIGKYKNGKLSISRNEITRINGPTGGSAKGKKNRGFRDFSKIG